MTQSLKLLLLVCLQDRVQSAEHVCLQERVQSVEHALVLLGLSAEISVGKHLLCLCEDLDSIWSTHRKGSV